MSSLARREDLAGKVQMVYIDPPYGIKFGSNFQPEIGKREVKDKETDLTREPETVKAYRDTWSLGVHSYLAYLRDRLIAARDLLADSGSIFVQIGDENVHLVRNILDEVFGRSNLCSQITLNKAASQSSALLAGVTDFVLWYAKDRSRVRYSPIYTEKEPIEDPAFRYICVEAESGEVHDLSYSQKTGHEPIPQGRFLRLVTVTSQTGSGTSRFGYEFIGKTYFPPGDLARRCATSVTILTLQCAKCPTCGMTFEPAAFKTSSSTSFRRPPASFSGVCS
jgi:adenine-specific DNA-methyltransferase